MAQPFYRRGLHLPKETLYLILAGIVFFAIYFVFLEYQNRLATSYLEAMRTGDPDTYLNEVRKLDGFEAYLDEYRALKGYDTPKLAAPIFLVGRWTLRDRTERIPVGSEPECTDPLIFEYGRFKVPDSGMDLAVLYAIEGNDLIVQPEVGQPFRARIVAYAATIDHLELTVPGRDSKSFAYRCVQ